MWDHKDGWKISIDVHLIFIYHLILIYKFCIIIDRAVGAPVHAKDVVDVLNFIDKYMLKLAMINILNIELIYDDPNFYKFMQVYETKEDQYVILG